MFINNLKYIVLIVILIVASFEDIRSKTIQNRLVLYGLITGLILNILGFTVPVVFDAFAGFLAGGGILLVVACISRGGVGMGDVKLMACAGLYLGIGGTLGCLAIAIISCGVFGTVLLFLRRYDRKAAISFAPFILIGTIVIFMQSLYA